MISVNIYICSKNLRTLFHDVIRFVLCLDSSAKPYSSCLPTSLVDGPVILHRLLATSEKERAAAMGAGGNSDEAKEDEEERQKRRD